MKDIVEWAEPSKVLAREQPGRFPDICLTRLAWLIMIGHFRVRETSRLSRSVSVRRKIANHRPQIASPSPPSNSSFFETPDNARRAYSKQLPSRHRI